MRKGRKRGFLKSLLGRVSDWFKNRDKKKLIVAQKDHKRPCARDITIGLKQTAHILNLLDRYDDGNKHVRKGKRVKHGLFILADGSGYVERLERHHKHMSRKYVATFESIAELHDVGKKLLVKKSMNRLQT